jgi:hypothetical protein
MSISTASTSIQYMYIPNLVGRQILRVPVLPCEEQTLLTSPGLSYSENTMPSTYNGTFISRSSTPESSFSVNVESVSDEE